MDLNVDANKLIGVLNEKLAAANLQNAILETALADAQEKAADLMRLMALSEQAHQAAMDGNGAGSGPGDN